MCTDYRPPEKRDLDQWFDHKLPPPTFDCAPEVFPGMRGPIVIGGYEWRDAVFGMMPHWAKPTLYRSTYNARSETVAEKPSFRAAWKARQFALVPMVRFFEPFYADEKSKSVRWRIERQDGKPFAAAAIWESRRAFEGDGKMHSFSLLTINADSHPLMHRFHRPGDEKRSIVIVPPEHYDDWLTATTERAREMLVELPAGEFQASADPLKRKKSGEG